MGRGGQGEGRTRGGGQGVEDGLGMGGGVRGVLRNDLDKEEAVTITAQDGANLRVFNVVREEEIVFNCGCFCAEVAFIASWI